MWLFCSCDERGLFHSFTFIHVLLSTGEPLISGCRPPHGTRASVTAARGVSRCDPRALEPRVSSCGPRALWLQRSGESPCRDRAWESCVGRWLPHHCTARQAPPAVSNHGVCLDVCASSRIVASVLTPPRGSTPGLSFPRALVPSLSTQNHHSIGNRLYFNTK